MGKNRDAFADPVAAESLAKMRGDIAKRDEIDKAEAAKKPDVEKLGPADESFFADMYRKQGVELYRPTIKDLMKTSEAARGGNDETSEES